MATFGTMFHSLRVAYGYSEEQFAKRVAVTKKAVSKWETGKSLPKPDVLGRIINEFPQHETALVTLYIGQDYPRSGVQKVRDDVQYRLAVKFENEVDKYLAGQNNEEIDDRIGDERVSYFALKSDHVFVVDFLSKLRERARENGQFITVKGEYNDLIFPFILGATRTSPIETRFICPKCKLEKCYYHEINTFDHKERCTFCKWDMINISQYCKLPYTEFDAVFCWHPHNVYIDVPPSFADFATNLAMTYFAPLYNLKRIPLIENGVNYYAIILDSGLETQCESVEQIPVVDSDDKIALDRPRIIIRPMLLNQLISKKLSKEKPNLEKLYDCNNIIALAQSFKEKIPKILQKDVDSVCTINQLINILIFMDHYHARDEKALNCKVIKELKKQWELIIGPYCL